MMRTIIAEAIAVLIAAPGDPVTREEFERRFAELEHQYKNDIAARDKAIAELRAELEARPAAAPSPLDLERAKTQKQLTESMMSQIETEQAYALGPRSPVSFNPDIALIADFLANWSNDRANNAYNRADVREFELDMRAAVHPQADAVAIVAIERDVENPVFPEPGEVAAGPDTTVNLEEVYLFLHDFGVPNLTAKIGRFNLTFGRQNVLHLHDLPTPDPPFVNQAFLAPEELSDAGLSLSWLIPNPWDQYFEVTFEIISGEGASSESPTLSGDLSVDSPAFNTHLRWNVDVARGWNLEIGGSWLYGRADADNARDVNLLGGDLTLVRADPSGGFNNFLLQSEFIHGIIDEPGGFTACSWGCYVLAQQQLHKDWYIGTRLDWTEDPNDPSLESWGVEPYVSWYWSDFLRFRLAYQHRAGDVPDADIVALQVTWVFGAHPPHPYWSMR